MVDTNLLKQLREMTGAGIMDCKKALEANDSDIDKAAQWLREKGIAKAVKKASRVSAEGLFNAILVDENSLLIYELNCETDFVASNAKFHGFMDEIGELIKASGAKNTEEALKATNAKGETLEQVVLGYTAVIGEKITLRSVQIIKKEANQLFDVYKHNGGKILVVTILEGGNAQVAHAISLSVCANNPQYRDESQVSEEWLNNERSVLTKEAEEEFAGNQAKLQRIPQIIEGKINKELKEICFVHQGVVIDPNLTVEQYLKDNGAKLVYYSRNVVGEGIEKKENDFVKEVMEQMK